MKLWYSRCETVRFGSDVVGEKKIRQRISILLGETRHRCMHIFCLVSWRSRKRVRNHKSGCHQRKRVDVADVHQRRKWGMVQGPIVAVLHSPPTTKSTWFSTYGRTVCGRSDRNWTSHWRSRRCHRTSSAVEVIRVRQCYMRQIGRSAPTQPGLQSLAPEVYRRRPWELPFLSNGW